MRTNHTHDERPPVRECARCSGRCARCGRGLGGDAKAAGLVAIPPGAGARFAHDGRRWHEVIDLEVAS